MTESVESKRVGEGDPPPEALKPMRMSYLPSPSALNASVARLIDGVVKTLNIEVPGKFEVSDAATLLAQAKG